MTAKSRAKDIAGSAPTETVAEMLLDFADEIEAETGRAYAPAYMREAARRLKLIQVAERQKEIDAEIDRRQQ